MATSKEAPLTRREFDGFMEDLIKNLNKVFVHAFRRFDDLERRLEQMDSRLKVVEERLGTMQDKVNVVQDDVTDVKNMVESARQEAKNTSRLTEQMFEFVRGDGYEIGRLTTRIQELEETESRETRMRRKVGKEYLSSTGAGNNT